MGIITFAAALIAATVSTAKLEEIYSDAPVVTNVTFDGLATKDDLAAEATAREQADETLATAVGTEASRAKAAEKTNTDAIAAETTRAKTAEATATAYTTAVSNKLETAIAAETKARQDADDALEALVAANAAVVATKADAAALNNYVLFSNLANVAFSGAYSDLTGKPTIPSKVSDLTNDAGYLKTETYETDMIALTDLIEAKADKSALSSHTSDTSNPHKVTAAQIGAATTTDLEATKAVVYQWEEFLDGSNVVFSITNYISGSYNVDAAKLRILELKDGEYHEVYNSRDEILAHLDNFRTNEFVTATNSVISEVDSKVASKADRAWGKYTSAGSDAPSNTVWMTAPSTVFAGGMEYQRVAVGEGAVCFLVDRGAPVRTQGDEGVFRFQDDGGTNYFGFAKTDSYTIGADADGIDVSTDQLVTLTYSISMNSVPCVWYKAELDDGIDWVQLNLPDGSATEGAPVAVSWDDSPAAGKQVCYVNCSGRPSGFFKATVEVAGTAKFITNMPADLTAGIVCTNTATGANGVISPIYNGTGVSWTWKEIGK